MKKLHSTLSLLTLAVMASLPLRAALLETTVTGDTYLRNDGSAGTWNDDADNEILVGGNGTTDNLRGLLRFDISSIVNEVNTTGAGDFANLTINSASLQVFERRGFARTVNLIAVGYNHSFDPATATWAAPATGDTLAGGTLGATLGSASTTWDATADNQDAAIALSSADLATLLAGHISGSVHLALRSNTVATNFLSITSDRSATATRRAKLVVDYSVAAPPAQRLVIINPPAKLRSLDGATATHVVTFQNTGVSANLEVTAALDGGAGISFVPPATFPLVIAPGTSKDLTLTFNPALVTPATATSDFLTITSNDPDHSSTGFQLAAAAVTSAQLLANGDFESPSGFDPYPIGWEVLGSPVQTASFLSGGGSAVTLEAGQRILQDFALQTGDALTNWQASLSLRFSAEEQSHRIRIEGNNGADLLTLRLTANTASSDSIDVFGGAFVPALSGLTLDANTTYHLCLTGTDFGLGTRSYTVAISTDGVNYITSAPLTSFHSTANAPVETVTIECGATAGSSLSVDNVIIAQYFPPADTFATWVGGYDFAAFPGANLTPEGDADRDGIANVLENVFGTAPNAATTGIIPGSSSPGTTTFQHRLNPDLASDVSYTYEWSTDLVEWKKSGESNTGGITASISAPAPAGGIITVTTTISAGATGKLFSRIVAAQSAP